MYFEKSKELSLLDRIAKLNDFTALELITDAMMGIKHNHDYKQEVMEVTKIAYNELSKAQSAIFYDATKIETADFRKQLDFLTYLMISIQHNIINGNNNEPNEQFQFTNDILEVCRKYKEDNKK